MELNLFTKLFFDRQFSRKQAPIEIWETLHTTVYYDLFIKKYELIMSPENKLISSQKFLVTCKLFSLYNEEELEEFFDFFDIFQANELDCESFYLVTDIMISVTLNTRVLYLFTHQSMIIMYLEEEQNSSFFNKQKMMDFAMLFEISSTIISKNILVMKDESISIDIKLGLVFLFRCFEAADNNTVYELGESAPLGIIENE